MKSTYKLLGVEWDHHPLPRYLPNFVDDKIIEHYSTEQNIFDIEKYERRIDISEVLSGNSLLPYNIRDKVKNCDSVYIRIDYEPEETSVDVIEFFYLRVLQVVAFFEKNLEDVSIFMIASKKAQEYCRHKYAETKGVR